MAAPKIMFSIRTSVEVGYTLQEAAREKNVSVNALISQILSEWVELQNNKFAKSA